MSTNASRGGATNLLSPLVAHKLGAGFAALWLFHSSSAQADGTTALTLLVPYFQIVLTIAVMVAAVAAWLLFRLVSRAFQLSLSPSRYAAVKPWLAPTMIYGGVTVPTLVLYGLTLNTVIFLVIALIIIITPVIFVWAIDFASREQKP